jgi:hypothetical protein
MLRVTLCVAAALLSASAQLLPCSELVWPAPQEFQSGFTALSLADNATFTFSASITDAVLDDAFARYREIIFGAASGSVRVEAATVLTGIDVRVVASSQQVPLQVRGLAWTHCAVCRVRANYRVACVRVARWNLYVLNGVCARGSSA